MIAEPPLFNGAAQFKMMEPSPAPVAVRLRGELGTTAGVIATVASAPVVDAVRAATRKRRETPLVTPSTTYVSNVLPVLGVIVDQVVPPSRLC